ncbi:unnamed protein product [Phytomonas sp. EM1]|nr:unnamed protein product [Phytomonas sp. EM1]|eukprot:CCW61051.1 unnamed protein product [Phytomonas sp. isolate EM1]
MRRSFILLGGLAETPVYDVIVSGGGMVGAAMLTSLLHLRRRMSAGAGAPSLLTRLMLVEAGRQPVYNPADTVHRLRTVSITPVSSKIVDNLGAWSKLTTKHSYYRIAVRHEEVNGPLLGRSARSRSFFMSSIVGGKATAEPLVEFTDLRTPLGFMCYNVELQSAMMARARELANEEGDAGARRDVTLFESTLGSIRLPRQDVESGALGRATVTGKQGGDRPEEVKFRLLLGCDGRGSALRGAFQAPAFEQDYGQVAFVCEARLAGVADGNVCGFQNFFRDGKIIAFLPTAKDSANIVFSTTPDEAKRLQGAPQRVLVQELNRRLHDFAPNDIPRVLEVPEGSSNGEQRRVQGAFPLRLSLVTRPYAPRALLLGDAAHSIHPFAGQGVNLGIYDVCALTGTLERVLRVGQDIGSVVAVGRVFAGEMIAHTRPMVASMEAIKAVTCVAPGLSCLGMKVLNSVPLLATLGKDAILQVASGASFAARHQDSFLLR